MKAVRILSVLVFFSSVLAEVEGEYTLARKWFGWGSGKSDSTPSADSKGVGDKLSSTSGNNPTGLGSGESLVSGAKDSLKNGEDPLKGLKEGGLGDGGHSESVVVKLEDGTTKTTSGKLLTTVTVVSSYTTSVSGPTVLTENGVRYVLSGPGVITVTNCPCTRTLTFMTSTVTKCVCTPETMNLEVLATEDMPFVNYSTKLGITGFGLGYVAFFLVFLTMALL